MSTTRAIPRRAVPRNAWAWAAVAFGICGASARTTHAEAMAPHLGVGYSHTCTVTTDGSLWCWGSNDVGQVGDGTTTDRLRPVKVTALGTAVAEIAAGDLFSCARKTDGTLWCWGSNAFGQLGNGSNVDSSTPVQVTALGNTVAEVSVGDTFACARKVDGTLWCWGAGYLGDGTTTGSPTPIAVTALGNAVAEVSTGDAATCARKTDGTLWCWGSNTFGVVGDGTTVSRSLPTQVTALGNTVAGVSLGDLFACARMNDGSLWCWGNNAEGELGDGTTTDHLVPAAVPALGAGVASVSANGRHACARTTSGPLRCWGWNAAGELGDGTLVNRTTPVAIAGFGSPAEVSAGINHVTCVRTATDAVTCAGDNGFGQLGDGTTVSRSVPVQVLPIPVAVPALATGAPLPLALLLIVFGAWRFRRSAALAGVAWLALATSTVAGCGGPETPAAGDQSGPGASPSGPTTMTTDGVGSISLSLAAAPGIQLSTIAYSITGPNGFTRTDTIDVSNATQIVATIAGIPAGVGYAMSLAATDVGHRLKGCHGTTTFAVVAGATTPLPVHLICLEAGAPATTPPAVPLSPGTMLLIGIGLTGIGFATLRTRPRPPV